MGRSKKNETRWLADLLAAYGAGVLGGPLSYEQQFGLWLNLERPRLQQADAVALGIAVALTSEDLSLGYYDAITPCPEAAEEAWQEGNFARQRSRMRTKYKQIT